MPGGQAAVYSGILRYTADDTGMAVILGHEVRHTIAAYDNERISQGLLAQLGGIALAVALSTKPQQTQSLFMAAYGAGANLGVLLPHSRLEESEADRIGLVLMARTGYDPRQAISFWKRMKSQEDHSQTLELLLTQPAPDTRIEDIRRHLPEALKNYSASPK